MHITMLGPFRPAKDGIAEYAGVLADALGSAGNSVSTITIDPISTASALSLPTWPTTRKLRPIIAQAVASDIVHLQFAGAAFHVKIWTLLRVLKAVSLSQTPVVATLHEVTRDLALLGPIASRIYRTLLTYTNVVVVHTAKAAVATSTLIEDGSCAVEVLPHFVDPPREHQPTTVVREAFELSGDVNVILAFGFIHIDKGLDVLVEAWRTLLSRRADMAGVGRVVVAGAVRRRRGLFRVFEIVDHLHLRRIKQAIRRDSLLSQTVIFAGSVPDEAVNTWFELAACAVLPYRRIEQSSVANLALGAGTPLVVSDAGELAALTAPDRVFPVGDSIALSLILEHELDRGPNAGSGRQKRNPAGHRLTSDDIATRLQGIYERLIARGKPNQSVVAIRESSLVHDHEVPRASFPDLSVVVCSFNGADVLGDCLKALENQSIKDRIEVIVVDDGSTDGTTVIAHRDSVRLLVHRRNLGLSAARNSGLSASAASIVAFIDDDCRPEPRWAEHLIEAWHRADRDVAGIGGEIVPKSRDTLIGRYQLRHNALVPLEMNLVGTSALGRLRLYLRSSRSLPPSGGRDVYSLVGANMSWRKTVLIALNGFDERFRFGADELELCLRLRKLHPTARLFVDPTVRVVHDFDGTLSDATRRARSYACGSARLARVHTDAPARPFPGPFVCLICAAVGIFVPWVGAAGLCVPYVVQPVRVREVRADPRALLDPLITTVIESAFDLALIVGWRQFRDLGTLSVGLRSTPAASKRRFEGE